MNHRIDTIAISTSICKYSDGTPMNESVVFYRVTDDTRRDSSCRIYHVSAQRDSFWRAIRAMRRLSVQKWEGANV